MTFEVPSLAVIAVVLVTSSIDARGFKMYGELLRSVEVPLIVSYKETVTVSVELL